MVYVQTMKNSSCVIQGDKIVDQGDVYVVKQGENITGVFDIGTIEFMYLTQPKYKEKEN